MPTSIIPFFPEFNPVRPSARKILTFENKIPRIPEINPAALTQKAAGFHDFSVLFFIILVLHINHLGRQEIFHPVLAVCTAET